jgi:UDP-GlcNAc:undecaprenyl-phosphate/decaprenyl-phosphate GlcNAc-1-phosphate transferase
MIYAAVFLFSLLVSILISPLTIKISQSACIFSKPNKGESKGKPCLGGIAVFTAFVTISIIMYFLIPVNNHVLIGLVFSSALILLLGIVDDKKDLKPSLKIVVELLATAILMTFGVVTKIAFLPVWLNFIITFVWILFITNAFNLLDIVDGLTSGLVIIISSTLLFISLVNKDVFSGIVLSALIGGHLGFLKYNYPPAKLYMGDTGSLFSGFLLAAIAINISYAPLEKPVALIAPVLIMSLPIYDTMFLIIMRVKKRKPIFRKTGDHFALRLMTMGHGIYKSIWMMYLFSIFLALSSLKIVFSSNKTGIFVLITVLLVFIILGKKAAMVKVDD